MALEAIDRHRSRLYQKDMDLCFLEIETTNETDAGLTSSRSKDVMETLDLATSASTLSDHVTVKDARLGRYLEFKRTVSSLSLGELSVCTNDIALDVHASLQRGKRLGLSHVNNLSNYLNLESTMTLVRSLDGKSFDECSRSYKEKKATLPLYLHKYENEEGVKDGLPICDAGQLYKINKMLNTNSASCNFSHRSRGHGASSRSRRRKAKKDNTLSQNIHNLDKLYQAKQKQKRIKQFIHSYRPSSAFESLLQEVVKREKKYIDKRKRWMEREMALRKKYISKRVDNKL